LWRDGRDEVRLVPVGGLCVVSGVGGVLFPCIEVVACGVDGRDSLPDVGVCDDQGCRGVVVVCCLEGLVDTTYQEDSETGKCGFGVAWKWSLLPVRRCSVLGVVEVEVRLVMVVGMTGVCWGGTGRRLSVVCSKVGFGGLL
jgi:hypothetical protein